MQDARGIIRLRSHAMLRAITSVALLLWSLVACVTTAPSDAWHRAMNEGFALYEAGRFAEAILRFEQALQIGAAELDPHDPNLATSLNNLATLYYAQGSYTEAEPLYR
jgi:tetratricopeptide (TPR) repeat protein